MRTFYAGILTALLATGAWALTATTTTPGRESSKQDMKDAGHDTKNAAKKTGHAVKKTTKKVVHKGAHETSKGANKVANKTQQNPQ